MERIPLTALAAALVAALVALGAASCATTPHEPLPPLTSIHELEVDYDAQVTSGTWDPKTDASFVDVDISKVEDLIDISTSFVELDPDQVEQLLARIIHERRSSRFRVVLGGASGARSSSSAA